MFADDNDRCYTAIKNTLVSSFAISLTLLVARLRDVISSATMVVGVNLSLSLWTAGMYALAIGHHPFKTWSAALVVYISCITFCSGVVLVAWILGEILPDFGNGDIKLCNQFNTSGLRLSPGGPIVTALKVALSILAIICALLTRWERNRGLERNKRELMWKWLSVVLVVIDLLAFITIVEIISNIVFKFKVEDLGLGQIMAMILVVGELMEIVIHFFRTRSVLDGYKGLD